MRGNRAMAAGLVVTAITTTTLAFGAGVAGAAPAGCPNAWKTGVGVPVPDPEALPNSLAAVEVAVGTSYQPSVSNPGEGICVAFWNLRYPVQVYSVTAADSSDGAFLIINGTPTQIPIP
jgi:hypothetical protein